MAAGSPRFRVDIPPRVAEVIRHLPPDLKRGVKAALRTLSASPHEGVPLVRELEGKWRYRVRRYRVVYEIDRRARVLRVVAVGDRRDIYERLAGRLHPPSAGP
ncbi:MAG: type II toxin-antitoxin system RelE/ParE family toxin [Candidatus Rokubacteria bacterium]|nr:type II toxin-antitoxin system RelE/ParE family toxin [Candidatus Rokubacteria bacterium]